MVRDLLQGFVKEEWVEQLDFSSLEKVSGSYVADDLRDREGDVIWRVCWGEEWLFVYLLLGIPGTQHQFRNFGVSPWPRIHSCLFPGSWKRITLPP